MDPGQISILFRQDPDQVRLNYAKSEKTSLQCRVDTKDVTIAAFLAGCGNALVLSEGCGEPDVVGGSNRDGRCQDPVRDWKNIVVTIDPGRDPLPIGVRANVRQRKTLDQHITGLRDRTECNSSNTPDPSDRSYCGTDFTRAKTHIRPKMDRGTASSQRDVAELNLSVCSRTQKC